MGNLKQCGICDKKIGVLTSKYIINNKTECVCADCFKSHVLNNRSVLLTPKTLNSISIDTILNNPQSIGKDKPVFVAPKPKTHSGFAFGFKLTSDAIKKGRETKSLKDVVARVESGSELQSRVTATRLLALGVFAFAAKKKKGGEKYLTIEGPDFVWTEEIKRDKKDISRAMDFVAQINNNAKLVTSQSVNSSEPTTENSLSAADELMKFKELLDSGAITQEEFDAQKTKILG